MSQGASTRELLHELFREGLHLKVPSPNVDLLATGIIDSLQLVELLAQLETRFGTHITLGDELNLDHFRSIARIEAFLQSRGAPNGQLG